jgi:diamine N-acetyltransferase
MQIRNLFVDQSDDGINIRIADKADIEALQKICDNWIEKGFFEGETLSPNHIEKCLTQGDLPPVQHADVANYALFVIENEQGILGLFDLYDGYPASSDVWISLFLLDVEHRGFGYGNQVIELIVEKCQKDKRESLVMAVSMNNRQAFNFWVNNGFKHILGVYGGLKYPVIGLRRKL